MSVATVTGSLAVKRSLSSIRVYNHCLGRRKWLHNRSVKPAPCFPRGLFIIVTPRLAEELRSCVKVEVDVLGSPSLIVRTVSVDVKQH